MNYDGHEALRRDMAGLAERLAGISLRRLSVLMDEAFNIALMLDESFLD